MRIVKGVIIFMIVFCVTLLVAYFLFPVKIELYNASFKITASYLDLSKIKIQDIDELKRKLSLFRKAKIVDLGNNYLTIDDKNTLEEMYSNIDFKITVKYQLCNKEFLDNSKEIDFTDCDIDNKLIKYIELFPKLEMVNLIGKELDLKFQEYLVNKFPYIKFKWSITIADESFASDITSLDLSNKKIEDKKELYSALKLFKELKNLDMFYTNLSNEDLDQLRKDFPALNINWVVKLGHNWTLRTDDVAFSVLIKKNPYLPLKTKDLEVFKYCTKLQALDLGHQHIEDITAIGEYLPELRILILSDNRIKDITPLKNLKHLHYVELFMNDITDVSPLSELEQLVDVNISFNPRFSNIKPLLNLPMLERLWLVRNKISDSDYRLIKETYPNVKLVNWGGGSTDSGWRTHDRYYAMIDMFNKSNYMSEEFSKYDK